MIDRSQKELMLRLLEDEKRKIEQAIASVRAELMEAESQFGKRKRDRSKRAVLSNKAQQIKEILSSATTLLTPAQIHEALAANHTEIEAAQIRNILRRHKGEIWESPGHGKWKIKGKQFDATDNLF